MSRFRHPKHTSGAEIGEQEPPRARRYGRAPQARLIAVYRFQACRPAGVAAGAVADPRTCTTANPVSGARVTAHKSPLNGHITLRRAPLNGLEAWLKCMQLSLQQRHALQRAKGCRRVPTSTHARKIR